MASILLTIEQLSSIGMFPCYSGSLAVSHNLTFLSDWEKGVGRLMKVQVMGHV